MADPGPVAQTFFTDEDIGNYYLLDSILTVVDAKHASKQLDEFHEAQEQVGFADRILMSKTDLVSEDEVKTLSDAHPPHEPARAGEEGAFRRGADRRAARHPRLQPERDPRARPGVPHRHAPRAPRRGRVLRVPLRQALRRRQAGAVPLRHDPGLRAGPAALQGRAVDEGQAAARGVPGRAHDDGRRHGQALGRRARRSPPRSCSSARSCPRTCSSPAWSSV